MESFLYSIDVEVFRWVNEGWSCSFLDGFFSFITDYHHFLLFLIPWLVYICVKGPRGRWLVLSLALAILIADQASSHLLKYWVERIRPCDALPDVRTPLGASSSFSFPSSHAANMGASMLLLSLAYEPWTWLFVLIGLLVGLSRVYLGLHYPSDVLGGYLLGIAVGYGVWKGMEKIQISLQDKKSEPKKITTKARRTRRKTIKKG